MDPIELEYEKEEDVPEAVRDLYTETDGRFVLTGVRGLKTEKDVNNVQEALRKEREERKKLADQFKPFKDMDPEEVRSKLDRVAELEAAAGGKLDEDAINKIVEGRLASHTAPLQRKIDELTEAATTAVQERDQALGTITDMKMTSAIRAAAAEAKVVSTAIPDIEVIAKSAFEMTDDGKLVTKEGSGVMAGLGLDAYFKEMQKSRPHWWPASEGGGAAGGGSRGPGGGQNPFSAEHWDLTKQGQMVRQNREQAEQLAKLAGTSIGGPKPKAKS